MVIGYNFIFTQIVTELTITVINVGQTIFVMKMCSITIKL